MQGVLWHPLLRQLIYKKIQLVDFGHDEHNPSSRLYIRLIKQYNTLTIRATARAPFSELLWLAQWIELIRSKLFTLSLQFGHHEDVRGCRRRLFPCFVSFFSIISCSHHWAVLLDAVKCASGVLWNSVAPDTAGALLLTPDPWKVCSVLPPGLMDEAESIDAPSPAALIRLSLFLSILLLGLIDSLQCLWPACLISEATMWDYQYVIKGMCLRVVLTAGHIQHKIETKHIGEYNGINYQGITAVVGIQKRNTYKSWTLSGRSQEELLETSSTYNSSNITNLSAHGAEVTPLLHQLHLITFVTCFAWCAEMKHYFDHCYNIFWQLGSEAAVRILRVTIRSRSDRHGSATPLICLGSEEILCGRPQLPAHKIKVTHCI